MKTTLFFAALLSAHAALAGSLANGVWTPSGCGEKPEAPKVDDQDVDRFNRSVNATNDWQLKARDYFACLIKEANADNSAIADKANAEQAKYKHDFDAIAAAIEAGKKKLDK